MKKPRGVKTKTKEDEREIDYVEYPLSTSAFLRKDVKEFIKRLKEEFCISLSIAIKHQPCNECQECKKIDKLAGEKLK